MSMQNRLELVKDYLHKISFILSYVNDVCDTLAKLTHENKNNIEYTEYNKDARSDLLIIEHENIIFMMAYNRDSGKILLNRNKEYKKLPSKIENLGGTDKDVMTLDDIIYVATHIKVFMEICIEKIYKKNNETIENYINDIKESAVADLL